MKCPQCSDELSEKGGHGSWCSNSYCKWGWEVEMDGSPLKPPTKYDGPDKRNITYTPAPPIPEGKTRWRIIEDTKK